MIPDFQSIMLPLLQFLSDEKPKSTQQIRDRMVDLFKITKEEQLERIPSGRQQLHYNRIAWAISYLKMANLIASPERSVYIITKDGLDLLTKKPEKITVKLLKEYPCFNENRSPRKDQKDDDENGVVEEKTPDELLAIGQQKIRDEISNQLLQMIKENTPKFFETLVVNLLIKMGYGGSRIDYGEIVGKSGDEGIDGIIKEDKLGLEKIYIQAKKWENPVGRPEIQKFIGALQGKHARKGIFITTATFSKEAFDYARNIESSIVLIDGNELTELMIDYELGVTIKETYRTYKMDTDFFDE
jgi:restriction system protein